MLRLTLAVLLLAIQIAAPAPAAAQDRRASHCIAVADAAPGLEYIHRASFHTPPADDFTVRIRYIDHSMFLIQTAGGLNVVTDFAGFIGAPDFVPDVVTMNNAHSSHWTPFPNPDIPHILPGWRDGGVPRDYNLDLDEMLIRNVTTDIRGYDSGDRVPDNNSIFIFEVAGLCIGHLGHLHHEPTEDQYAALGRLDVVMAAVDGGLTVPTETMTRIVGRLKSSIVLPMHWFSGFSLARFLEGVGGEFDIRRDGVSSIEVSLRDLPSRPTVVVLEPQFLTLPE